MEKFVFICGVQRSGTSSLANFLAHSPSIIRTLQTSPEPRMLLSASPLTSLTTQAYFGLMPAHRDRTLLEKSTSYGDNYLALERILDIEPLPHIVFVLRNPFERAISHYKFSRLNKLESLPPAEAFDLDFRGISREYPDRISANPYTYLRRSHYASYLAKWREAIPEENLHLWVLEDIIGPKYNRANLFSELGVQIPRLLPRLSRANSLHDGPLFGFELRDVWREWLEASNEELASWGVNSNVWR